MPGLASFCDRASRGALPLLLRAAVVAAAVSVAVAATPGEATDLTVTSINPATGVMSLTWTPACAASDHHIEFGPLDAVAGYGYAGQVCGLGAGGAYGAFNPGAASYFFVIVGDDGVGTEGSYGTSFISGVAAERPPDTIDPVCPRVQDLTQRCDGPFVPLALGMTAYRPVTGGASGAAFLRRAVPESEEIVPGAGIRVNGDDDDGDAIPDRDDAAVAGENDLIEVVLNVDPPTPPAGYDYILSRTNAGLRVWSASTKGTEVLPAGSAVIAFTSTTRTVWVENPLGGTADLVFEARPSAGGSPTASDTVRFRPFTSVVIALGGEGQVPADPPLEPTNHGTFQLAITLVQKGYDVHMYDEDVVPANGAGAAFNEVASAVRNRAVSGVAIFGYSHGGGSTNDLSRKLDAERATIGSFTIDLTAYVDGIDNDSDFDIDPETALPPSTGYHANWYEHPGCGFLQLCGAPVPGANLNVNVTAQPWGSSLTHFTIDDAPEVLQALLDLVILHVAP
jgi:hypothetical protein